jgi:hypothetical protein
MNFSEGTAVHADETLDDSAVLEVAVGIYARSAVLIAHRLKLFPLLAAGPRSLQDVCAELGIEPRPARGILAAAASLGFVAVSDGSYALTPLSEKYLLETSPTYFGYMWDMLIGTADGNLSYSSVERAVRSDKQQAAPDEEHVFQSVAEQAEAARVFTRAMHSGSVTAGLAWPGKIDLSGYTRLLDVAGGSGAHAIGAVTRWPHLRATIFDLAPVCDVAAEFIAKAGCEDRVETHTGDMWDDSFPEADLHFYSNIYHDWARAKGEALTRKSYQSLPSGGRLIVHEMLFDDDKAGPSLTAGLNLGMLLWSLDGGQYSGHELSAMLIDAGFHGVETIPTTGGYSIVTGVKP